MCSMAHLSLANTSTVGYRRRTLMAKSSRRDLYPYIGRLVEVPAGVDHIDANADVLLKTVEFQDCAHMENLE
jgi:hypothetical protein